MVTDHFRAEERGPNEPLTAGIYAFFKDSLRLHPHRHRNQLEMKPSLSEVDLTDNF